MTAVPDWWRGSRVASIVVDNESWVLPYARQLVEKLKQRGDDALVVRRHEDVRRGAVAFYLGCVKKAPD